MSERPGVLFACIIITAGLISGLLLAGLSALGPNGVAGIVVTLVGAFSACVFFLTELRAVPIASLALVAVTTASLFRLVRVLVRNRRQQRVLRALPLEPARDPELVELARAAGARSLDIARARRPAAFCTGLLRPRIVVTTGLLARLAPDERAAVIWHEARHARLREPLRCLITETAANAFFWLPALRDIHERYRLARELDADRAAISHTSRRALAGAMCQVMIEPGLAGSVGLADNAAARIDRLLDPAARLPRVFNRTRLLASGVGLAALTLSLAAPADMSLDDRTQLDSMLLSSSVHGLPGMVVGLALNTAALIGATLLATRLRGGRTG